MTESRRSGKPGNPIIRIYTYKHCKKGMMMMMMMIGYIPEPKAAIDSLRFRPNSEGK